MTPSCRAVSSSTLVMPVLLFLSSGCGDGAARQAAIDQTQSQVLRMAADLDKMTTETGSYDRARQAGVQENDSWGTPIEIRYAQGGVVEEVTVRSAGPDKQFHTGDDLVAKGMSASLKGLGEGIKKNAEETSANVAKGLVKGTVAGVKDAVKDALPFKKKSSEDPK